MKDISRVLKSIGLLDSETRTYNNGLELGPATVIELSKSTGLSRQACYVAIEALRKKGLMSSLIRGKKRLYTVEEPEKLLAYARRRQTEIKDEVDELARSVPELKLRIGGEKPVVKVFEGKEGLRAILEDAQSSNPKELLEITDLKAMSLVLKPEDLMPYRQGFKKMGTKVRAVYSGQPLTKVIDSERYALPEKYSDFMSDVTVYDDKVALVTFVGKMNSIIIEDKAIAAALRIVFKLALETAQKYPQI